MKFFIDLDGCMDKGQKVSTMVVIRLLEALTKLIERMGIPQFDPCKFVKRSSCGILGTYNRC